MSTDSLISEYERRIHIGCSGYYYKHWIGRFYPGNCKTPQFFRIYQEHFHTVEVNTTFYHFPTSKQIDSWILKSKDSFIFTFKAPRLITHQKRLVECEDSLLLFLHLIRPVKEAKKLGAILFQTPATLIFNLEILESFMDILPSGYRYAFEFRNSKYYNEDVYKIFIIKNIDPVYISEARGIPCERVTASFKYFRLHGKQARYASNYTDEQLYTLAEKIKFALQNGASEVYVYFNNDFNAYAPHNAMRLKQIVKEVI
jgi:uncharacterized protein YecE (DUF72 family)